jgi:hypothetical protein
MNSKELLEHQKRMLEFIKRKRKEELNHAKQIRKAKKVHGNGAGKGKSWQKDENRNER